MTSHEYVSPTGWNAIFKPYRVEPVVGWDEFGVATVIDPARGRKVSVDDLRDHSFENLEPAERPFVGALPAAGWTIEWPNGETEAVLGFAVQDDGYVHPVLTRTGGYGSPAYVEVGEPKGKLIPPRSDS